MSAKERPRNIDRRATTRSTSRTVASDEERVVQPQIDGALPQVGVRVQPSSISCTSILHLQRMVGNRATDRLINGPSRATQGVIQPTRQQLPAPMGMQARALEPASTPSTGTSGGGLLQLVRQLVNPPAQPADIAGMNQAWADTQTQINDIEQGEIDNGFIDMADINRWSAQCGQRIAAAQALNPGAAQYTLVQIQGQVDATATAFRNVLITLSNLRKALNDSFNGHTDFVAKQHLKDAHQAELDKYKPEKAVTGASGGTDAPSPTWTVDQYYKDREGAVVLVDGDYIVFLEHYQLKHNAELGVLKPGGPFKGKKGSTLPGGYDAHKSTYAPFALTLAKQALAADENVRGALPKGRNGEAEIYVTIIKEGKQWLIFYHGNPPK